MRGVRCPRPSLLPLCCLGLVALFAASACQWLVDVADKDASSADVLGDGGADARDTGSGTPPDGASSIGDGSSMEADTIAARWDGADQTIIDAWADRPEDGETTDLAARDVPIVQPDAVSDGLGVGDSDLDGSAGAQPKPGDQIQLALQDGSDLCLAVPGAEQNNYGWSGQVTLARCASGNATVTPGQRWVVRPVADDLIWFINQANGLCLGVMGEDGHLPGAATEVFDCYVAANRDEHWRWRGTLDTGLDLENALSGLCLTPVVGDSATVTNCAAASGRFAARSIPLAAGHWVDDDSGLCLAPATTTDFKVGGGLVLRSCANADASALWATMNSRTSYARYMLPVAGLCLDVVGVDSHSSGAALQTYPCNPTYAAYATVDDPMRDEEWRSIDLGAGRKGLQVRSTGLCLCLGGHAVGGSPRMCPCDGVATAWTYRPQ